MDGVVKRGAGAKRKTEKEEDEEMLAQKDEASAPQPFQSSPPYIDPKWVCCEKCEAAVSKPT